jgi:hypothetical protein
VNWVFQTHQYFGCQFHRSQIFCQNSKIFIYFSQVIQSANNCHSYQAKTKIATIIQKQTRPNASRGGTPNGKPHFWLISTHGLSSLIFAVVQMRYQGHDTASPDTWFLALQDHYADLKCQETTTDATSHPQRTDTSNYDLKL